MSRSLVGIRDPQLRSKDFNVNLFSFLMCKALIWWNLVPIITCCVCVFLVAIHWFRVMISYKWVRGHGCGHGRYLLFWSNKARWSKIYLKRKRIYFLIVTPRIYFLIGGLLDVLQGARGNGPKGQANFVLNNWNLKIYTFGS
jgi:hypothetical protein